MSKNKNNFTWGDALLGVLAVGAAIADSPVTVFVPRGTNVGFSNPTAAKEYAEKYLGGTQVVTTVPHRHVYVVSETRTPSLYGDQIVRYFSDGSTETVTPGIFGETVKRTGGYSNPAAAVIRSVAVPIDRQSRKPSTLDGGRVYQSLTDWEWR